MYNCNTTYECRTCAVNQLIAGTDDASL